jgi:AcrR family transcriptional regulator
MANHSSNAPDALRADARRNRQRLLDVAHAAFLEYGVTASMDEIARRAGVGSGTLYRHFPTRDALILALVAGDLERLAELADDLRADDDASALERWLGALAQHNRTYRGLAESIIAATGQSTPLGEACARIHAAGEALVSQAQRDGTIRADITGRDAIDLATAVAWVTEHDGDDRRGRVLLQVAIDGLQRKPS